MDEFNDFSADGKEAGLKTKLTRKQKIIIALTTGVLGLSLVFFGARGLSGSSASKERNNTLSLVKMYMDKGEYDRALDKIEELLVKNADDKDALKLMDEIFARKKESDSSAQSTYNNYEAPRSQDEIKVEVDTDGFTEAMKSSIESMRDELAKSNENMKNEIAKNNKAQEENRKAMEKLLQEQKEAAAKERELKKAEEERRAKEEARREAERKAQEEKKKAEEARKKAEEEALARKNDQLKKEIENVNKKIAESKTSIDSGNFTDALNKLDEASNGLPVSEGEPAFSAKKYSEMASMLLKASEKASTADDKNQLLAKSLEYANKAVELNPQDPEANYILAQDSMDKKNYQKAIDYYSKAIKADSSNYEYFYNLGRAQYMIRKYSEAKVSFQTAANLNSNFAPARYNLGLTNLKLNDKKSAKNQFIMAHDIDPRYEKAFLEEGRVLVQLGEYQNAIQAYQKVISLNNVNRKALQELGSVYSQINFLTEAENCFRKSLALLPAGTLDPLTYYNLSTVLFEQNKPDEAITYAKKAYESKSAIKDLNSQVNIVYNYALISEKTGKEEVAIEKYAEVLSLNPNHIKTEINLGVMYMNMLPPDVDMALSLFTKAVTSEPKNFEANNNLGSAYLSKKEYENAIKYFQNALLLDSKNNDVRFNLGQAFAGDQQFDNAKTTYLELLRLDGNYWDGYIELAKVCMALNDNVSAEKYLIVVQEKKPGYKGQEVAELLSKVSQ